MTRRTGTGGQRSSEELVRFALPASIRVVDAAAREIEVCATSEAVDTYGTIFSYAASREAFTRWVGNVREMHDRKAVGRKVAVRFDDAAKKVYVRLRISKGADDTWEKVKDGTLAGASIGASNVTWAQSRATVGGVERSVDVATRYDLMELSLVDNASNPDAQGITFVRMVDGPSGPQAGFDEALLDALPSEAEDSVVAQEPVREPAAPIREPVREPGREPVRVSEPAGVVTTEPAADDVAVAIAARALSVGLAALAAPQSSGATQPLAGRAARLAALGAPTYTRASSGTTNGEVTPTGALATSGDALGGTAPGAGQSYDADGDHEEPSAYVTIQSGPTAGAVMAPSPAGSVAHMAHSHLHTGRYDDPSDHRETSAHQHFDGTSHIHEHVMDHDHGGVVAPREGHTHPHIHVPEHGHHYRVADGAPRDSRLVSGAEAQRQGVLAVVSEAAFRAAGGVEGRGLTAEQRRVALAEELRLVQVRMQADAAADVQRETGAYSRDPHGPPDSGTPAAAAAAPTAPMSGQADGAGNGGVPAITAQALLDLANSLASTVLCRYGPQIATALGQVRALDRDGQNVAGADANGASPAASVSTTGTLDVSTPADGWTGRLSAADSMRRITETITGAITRAVAGEFDEVKQRLARIEAQPQAGGPVLRAADRATPLSPGVVSSHDQQLAALSMLAGRILDPQAQVAVAAEMIRLQQEATGMGPAQQVMPRAGMGHSGPVGRSRG